MKPTVLVATAVHWPDDTRIRERLIRSLSTRFQVLYAAPYPGPTDPTGLLFVPLKGGRLRRNLGAIRVALGSRWDVLVIHDLELIPCAFLARLIRRRPVVFDVHEDFPAAAHTRSWMPKFLREPVSRLIRRLLRFAERSLTITLAEAGYEGLFSDRHPVFPNLPDTSRYPEAGGEPEGPAVYLGDVTHERGADIALAACTSLGLALTVVGRVSPAMRAELGRSSGSGNDLVVPGPMPNPEAMGVLALCSVGLCPLRDLPNYRSSQPTKILEYLAMGLPVVASDLPGTRSLVEGLDAVFLTAPGDSAALAEAITRARDPAVLRVARAQAVDIRDRYSWPASEVVDFYESLASPD